MRVHPASLQGQLEKGIAPFYFLFGPEILLVEEALDLIRRKAREQGYGDRESHTVERGFNWDLLHGASQSISLFMEKKILEVRMPGGRPGDQGARALVDIAGIPPSPDTLLLMVSGPVDKRSQGSKWFQAVESVAVMVECPEVGGDRLPEWIAGRFRAQELTADREAVRRLAHYVEGNLLAAAQQINQLCLLAEDGRITVDLVESIIADSARFSNFNFADACLAGSAGRAVRILGSLRMGQAEPILILWALTREVRILCQLSAIRESGGNPNTQFRKHGIWRNREPGFRAALNRLSADRCRRILRRLARADLQLKGQAPLERRDIWEEIESIGLDVCGVRIP
ncbi:MAG: DNA polymerase III subunit delta [Gammaproteobacteria bacterium]|nr:DNA polymerase III subunit delta [Gammaproteobacteria bacterium]